jgi:uncharacterized membrane protein YgdD (TMEM256/DUF423 family)
MMKSVIKIKEPELRSIKLDYAFSKAPSMMLRHMLFGATASIGGLCLIGGFIWFLVEKFAR